MYIASSVLWQLSLNYFSKFSFFLITKDRCVLFTGYMLLAGRCRNPSECKVIQEVIEKQMKRSFDPDSLFGYPSLQKHSHRISSLMEEVTTVPLEGFKHIVWTYSMRRLAVLAGRALKFGEPVLLVGETGYCDVVGVGFVKLLEELWMQLKLKCVIIDAVT